MFYCYYSIDCLFFFFFFIFLFFYIYFFFFFQAEDGIRDLVRSRGLGDVYKRQMMGWMNNFTAPEKMRDTKSHEEIMAYLQSQKVEITKVRDTMNGSIAAVSYTHLTLPTSDLV